MLQYKGLVLIMQPGLANDVFKQVTGCRDPFDDDSSIALSAVNQTKVYVQEPVDGDDVGDVVGR